MSNEQDKLEALRKERSATRFGFWCGTAFGGLIGTSAWLWNAGYALFGIGCFVVGIVLALILHGGLVPPEER